MAEWETKTIMQIGALDINITKWPSIDDELSFSWMEHLPEPYSNNEVEECITKDVAIDLINLLQQHFNIK